MSDCVWRAHPLPGKSTHLPDLALSAVGLVVQEGQQRLQVRQVGGRRGGRRRPRHDPAPLSAQRTCHLQLVGQRQAGAQHVTLV